MNDDPSSASVAAARFHCVIVAARDVDGAEMALAEAMGAGASGAEQRDAEDGGSGVTLYLYTTSGARESVVAAAVGVVGSERVRVEEVVARDWSEEWKKGLRAIEVSPRLRVRPSFDASVPGRGQRDLVIDPGQAFGTGGHESTRLALRWIDALRGELAGASGVLDVGAGTGVLALAALALGAERATAFDLDPLAAPAARENAVVNGHAAALRVFTGPIESLADTARFRGVVANMLRRELEPVLPVLASHVAPDGWVVFSGLLDDEVAAWTERAEGVGLARAGVLHERDASGIAWASVLMRPRAVFRASVGTESSAASP
jgi:ribosomal protein L11 methyltransferase